MLRSRTGMLAIPPGLMRWIFGVALAASLLAIGCNGPDSRVRGAIQAGDEAARQRALREALNHYRTAAVAEPASLEAQTRRGAMAELLGEFDEALDAYGRASRLRSSALAYYRAGAMADRMGNTVLATEYLNASMQALPTRGERWAQTGQRAIERLITSLDGSRWARMLPDWVFRSLHLSRVALANAVLDREVVAAALFTTLLEAGETERALEVARGRGWVREGHRLLRGHARGGGGRDAGPGRHARRAGARGLSPPAGTRADRRRPRPALAAGAAGPDPPLAGSARAPRGGGLPALPPARA